MNELALFAGAGGGLLASKLLGWNTIGAVEIERYPREVLLQRQRDGILEKFPIWDDVRTFDGNPWKGKVDIITGGFPCQDISAAGKGKGITGERSGLWKEFKRIIGEVEPQFIFAENSPLLRTRGLGTVLQDLAELGYDARWCVLGAWHCGANHKRDRMWVLAYPKSDRWIKKHKNTRGIAEGMGTWAEQRPRNGGPNVSNTVYQGLEGQRIVASGTQPKFNDFGYHSWWQIEPNVGRVANGVASDVDELGKIKASRNEREQLSKASTEKNEECGELPMLRGYQNTPSSSPQRQEQGEQRDGKPVEGMPEMPQRYPRGCGRLGAWEDSIKRGELQNMWEIIHSNSLSRNQKEFLVWFGSMQGREWSSECVTALGDETGMNNRVNRLKAIGNGQVPIVAATAFNILMDSII